VSFLRVAIFNFFRWWSVALHHCSSIGSLSLLILWNTHKESCTPSALATFPSCSRSLHWALLFGRRPPKDRTIQVRKYPSNEVECIERTSPLFSVRLWKRKKKKSCGSFKLCWACLFLTLYH
jgi:hypothetical protein